MLISPSAGLHILPSPDVLRCAALYGDSGDEARERQGGVPPAQDDRNDAGPAVCCAVRTSLLLIAVAWKGMGRSSTIPSALVCFSCCVHSAQHSAGVASLGTCNGSIPCGDAATAVARA
eukprot:361988-Chlamydomonas_euryale.AAC.2